MVRVLPAAPHQQRRSGRDTTYTGAPEIAFQALWDQSEDGGSGKLGTSVVGFSPASPLDRRPTVLSIEEVVIIVAFRRHTLLALDDCL